MSTRFPSSRAGFRPRFSVFDVVWAFLAPLIALFVRDAPVISVDGAASALLYCTISFAFSLITFLAFRLSDGMSRHFSVDDAFNTIKAVVSAGLLTSVVVFTLTRLDGIPRSVPFLNMLILAAGLFTARTAMLLFNQPNPAVDPYRSGPIEHVILIGSTQLSSLYIKFLRAYLPHQRQVTAVLDQQQKLIGGAICGVPVIAPPEQLDSIIEELRVHGVPTDRVIIGGDETLLTQAVLAGIRSVCEQREIPLDFVPTLVGLGDIQRPKAVTDSARVQEICPDPPRYFQLKRVIDFFGALAAIIVLSPLFLMTALLVLIDVGSPVLFWQQRMGQDGRTFLIRKFRTFRAPFDWNGQPAAEGQRLSWIGTFLRKLRLDELPQLFNVLVGDMSLIGPRPLLPHDQPANAGIRLSVRPGITGWAQVNGGSLITTEEKGALDEWYIRNASLWLDLRIVALTLRFLLTGERRSEEAVNRARAEQAPEEGWRNVTVRPVNATSPAAVLRVREGTKQKWKPAVTRRLPAGSQGEKPGVPWQIKPLQ